MCVTRYNAQQCVMLSTIEIEYVDMAEEGTKEVLMVGEAVPFMYP